jgi:uncharacterized protein (DUF2141 family)
LALRELQLALRGWFTASAGEEKAAVRAKPLARCKVVWEVRHVAFDLPRTGVWRRGLAAVAQPAPNFWVYSSGVCPRFLETFMFRSGTIALALGLALCGGLSAAHAETAQVKLSITDIKTASGFMMVGLYDEAGYTTDKAVADAKIEVTADTATATFENLAPGTYAFQLYHDVNGNGKMDTNPFGMPTEPYAFSNNAKGSMGPAKWPKASFAVAAGETIHSISLK